MVNHTLSTNQKFEQLQTIVLELAKAYAKCHRHVDLIIACQTESDRHNLQAAKAYLDRMKKVFETLEKLTDRWNR